MRSEHLKYIKFAVSKTGSWDDLGLDFGKKDVDKGGEVVHNLVWLDRVMGLVHLSPEIGNNLEAASNQMKLACISQF